MTARSHLHHHRTKQLGLLVVGSVNALLQGIAEHHEPINLGNDAMLLIERGYGNL
jgi:hypothetical protein